MSIPSDHVAVFRSLRADRYVDACVVTRVTGLSFNNTTGQTEETTSEVYDGECLVRPAQAREEDFGEDRRQKVDYDIEFPFDAPDFEEDDTVTNFVSVHDPRLETMTMTVLRGFVDSYLTYRLYECEVVFDD